MHQHTRTSIDRFLASTLLLLMAAGCGQTQSCGCGEVAPYPAEGLLIDQGMQLRVTEKGITSLESAIVPLIASQLGAGGTGGLGFCVPPTSQLTIDVCGRAALCDDGSAGCQLDMAITAVAVNPGDNGPGTPAAANPDTIEAVVDIGELDEVIPLNMLGAQCNVHAWVDPGDAMVMTAELAMTLPPSTERLELQYLGSSMDVTLLQIDINGARGGLDGIWDTTVCKGTDGLAGIGFVRDLIISLVTNMVEPQVESAVNGFLCVPCDAGCPTGSTCNADNLCIDDTNGACVAQPMGTEGRVDVGEMLAGFGNGEPAWLSFSVYPGNYADAVDNGISMGVQTGITSEYNPCVPAFDPPSAARVARSAELAAEPSPGGFAFDASVGISESFLEHAMWAVYNNGTLCLEVSSETVPALSTSMFGLLLGSLKELTQSVPRPILISLAPKQPPTVRIGSGEVTQDAATGEWNLVEGLVTIELSNFDIDIYAFIFDRYARILTVNTDIELPIALTVDNTNALVPVVGDLSKALIRAEVRNSELVAESPSSIEALLPVLISSFLPSLAGGLSQSIALPDFMGFQLEVQEMTGIESNTMVGLFASLSYIGTGNLTAYAQTTAQISGVEIPFRDYLRSDGTLDWERWPYGPTDITPTVELSVSAQHPSAGDAVPEFSYRVDQSLWSIFVPGSTLRVRHPSLLAPGAHTIEVRSRLRGRAHTLDPSPEALDVVMDWTAPTIQGVRGDGAVARIVATDDLSTPADLRYRSRVGSADWSSWSTSPQIALDTWAGRRIKVHVQVQDGAGNTATASQGLTVRGLEAPVASEVAGAACACSVRRAPGSTSPPLLLCVGLLGLVGLGRGRRRRSRGARAVMAVAGLVFGAILLLGCDDDTKATEDPCGGCEPGFACVDRECVAEQAGCADVSECLDGQVCEDADGDGAKECRFVETGCTSDAECATTCAEFEVALCIDGGACACEAPCKDGCPTDQYCCKPQDSCLPVPSACGAMSCEAGYELQVQAPGVGDPNTCIVEDPVCACVELPPLPMGRFGMYTNIATQGAVEAVSAYNQHYGDLLVGLVDDQAAITWTFVDGVPSDQPIVGALGGPRGGVRAEGRDVGRYTDIAVGDDGTLHVSYQDADEEDLLYARGTPAADGAYTWTTHTVDTDGRSGFWTSLSLDPSSGAPGIAYMVAEVVDATDKRTYSELRFARADAGDPSAWTVSTLHRADVSGPCGVVCGGGEVCRLASGACEAPAADTTCTAACGTDQRCFADGSCAAVFVESTAPRAWLQGVGLHTAQARRSDGRVGVVFYDSLAGNLMMADESSPGTFEPATVLAGEEAGVDSGNIGLWPAIAFDDQDNAHIAYVDWTRRDLRYLDAATGIDELVDDGVTVDAFGPSRDYVGDDASIQLVNGAPTIVYQDSTQLLLVVAQRDAASGTFVQTLASGEARGADYAGAPGFYGDHVVRAGVAHAISFVVNQQARPVTMVPVLVTQTL